MKFYINDSFKMNQIKKNKTYKIGYKLSKSIPLSKVRFIKKKYVKNCLNTLKEIEKINKTSPKWYQRRIFKMALALVLFVGIISFLNLTKIKTLTVIVDGETKQVKTKHFFTPIYVDKLKDRYHLDDYNLKTDMGNFVVNGSTLNINSLKNISVKTKSGQDSVNTYATTLKEFLSEYNKDRKENLIDLNSLGKEDKVLIKNISELKLVDRKVKMQDKEEIIKYNVKYVNDNTMTSGKQKVKQKGVNGKVIYTYENIYLDGKKSKTKKSLKKTLVKKQDEIILLGTKTSSKNNASVGTNVWDRLAKCESGGNWHTNTGNGYYGGLQFSKPTWDSVASKVGVTAKYPHLASKEEQIKAATYLQKRSGWGQWPACTAAMGLR